LNVRNRSPLALEPVIVIAALMTLCALSWAYLWAVPMPMAGMDMRVSPGFMLLRFLMWFIMMLAMMTPANLPAVLLFHRVVQNSSAPLLRTMLFAGGYFAAWGAFSLLATALQFGLSQVRLINDAGAAQAAGVNAGLLAAVGIYQWIPLKNRCLDHCRSPIDFLTHHFRPGVLGASIMGMSHGLYCLGCCWLLMLLLFVGGVMNLLWIAGITLVIVVEKLLSRGRIAQRLIGSGLVIAAGVVAVVNLR
jgi:predicted metal-binding membrane protein